LRIIDNENTRHLRKKSLWANILFYVFKLFKAYRFYDCWMDFKIETVIVRHI
jgi:hypothetical protein